MKPTRLISRLDIKGHNLIKGINLEGLRILGDSNKYAVKYYEQGIDELLYMDCVASLYGRNNLLDVVKYTAQNIFIPLTVGGGVRTVQDADDLLRSGADKIAINTEATKRPELITEIANRYGNQCVVLSIEAKRINNKWLAYCDNGRHNTTFDVIEWAKKGESLGAGEILLTAVDLEGTGKGFDIELVKAVTDVVTIPVIASGGFGKVQDFSNVVLNGHASGVAIADAFHYDKLSISDVRTHAQEMGIRLRNL